MAGHVFISYSRADRAYVDTLAAHLDDEAIPLWYDREMRAGDRFATEIQDQIDTCVGFVVVLTPAALGSEWVNRELSYAVHVGKRVLPLLLEPLGPGRDHILLAGLSRTRVIPLASVSNDLTVRVGTGDPTRSLRAASTVPGPSGW